MQNKLFVGNLSFTCSDSQLSELFGEYGEVTSAKVVTDRDTGRARGFAFVEMSSQQQAEDAIRGLEGHEFGGRVLHVSIAQPKEQRSNNYSRR
ncbi:MAG: RNA-binding protein [Candidatus Melainabacteria bacterium]|nr:MAG: RNA-binding protein [Candidatus Melainabacteria bacterium]